MPLSFGFMSRCCVFSPAGVISEPRLVFPRELVCMLLAAACRRVSAQIHTITLACTHSRENHSLTTVGWRVYHQAVCTFISTCAHIHRYLRAFCSLASVIFILYCAKFRLPLFSNNNQNLCPVGEPHRNVKSPSFTILIMC